MQMNKLNNKPFERRTFLRGLGTAMALPWLESLAPRGLRATSTELPKRMAFVYMPNGAIMPQWTPKQTGRDYELSPTLKALEPVRDQIQILSGLAHEKAEANGDGGGDHARANATFLTASQARKTAGSDIHLGVSVDQVAAAKVGHLTRFPSVELGCDKPRGSGKCDSGYSCAYQYNMAWKSENQPVPPEHDPKLAFERLFGAEKKDTAKRNAISEKYDKSLLDFVLDDAKKLQKQLGQTDRHKLDQYLTSVREIEQRIARSQDETASIPDFKKPSGIPSSHKEHLRLMYDIMLLAFQSDSTRILTFYKVTMVATEASMRWVCVKAITHLLTIGEIKIRSKKFLGLIVSTWLILPSFYKRWMAYRKGRGHFWITAPLYMEADTVTPTAMTIMIFLLS